MPIPINPAPPSKTQQGSRWRGAPHALPPALVLCLAVLGGWPAPLASAARARTATVTVSELLVKGSQVTIAGRVRLPVNNAATRKRTQILLTLSAPHDSPERWTVRPDSHLRFKAVRTTRFTGSVALAVSVKLGGRTLGHSVLRTISVPLPSSGTTGTQPTTGSGSGSGSGSGTGSGSGPGTPQQPTTLNGTFELETGKEVGGKVPPTGSWFEMFDPPTWTTPLENPNSTLTKDQDYTPLSAGTDAGLETFAYEPAPSPAYNKEDDPLFDEIMEPQSFFGDNFSVLTEATDPQTKEADPLPAIVDDNGQLSGQITAWAVGWNGQWFNQGSPKPNGTLPAGSAAVSGTYDAATGHYVLEWKSLIVGGAFTNHAGLWHLEGTFVPAG